MNTSFNWKQYLTNYPDLVSAGINTSKSAYRHYMTHGISEGRTDNKIISPFNPKQKKVILFANVRDEPSIKEWLTHHLLLGFDCIYIFDHLSVLPLEEELYNFDPRVTTIRISEQNTNIKLKCIKFALSICRNINAEWMLYLDADEFLVLNKWNSVHDLLSDFNHTNLIAINWLMFGTSGHVTSPSGLIIDNYTKCDKLLNKHIKSFVRPNKVLDVKQPHSYIILEHFKFYSVNNNSPVKVDRFVEHYIKYQDAPAYIAHYYTQSEEIYISRKIKRSTDLGGFREYDTNLHRIHNEVENLDVKNKYSENIHINLNKCT
jgi:hypothetical protein